MEYNVGIGVARPSSGSVREYKTAWVGIVHSFCTIIICFLLLRFTLEKYIYVYVYKTAYCLIFSSTALILDN